MATKSQPEVNINNKKVFFQYEIIDRYIAGVELLGTEIKSIRMGRASLVDAYCQFHEHELFIKMTISEYKFAGHYNHEPNRERKLLLMHRELKLLRKKVQTSGLTIVPIKMFINEKGLAKIQIALAKGKSAGDKRESMKERDANREMDRAKKNKS